MDATRLEWFRAYFAASQPEWTVDSERRVLRVMLDEENVFYCIRETIDVDLQLFETPEALERFMLLQLIRTWHSHLTSLMKTDRIKAKVE